MYIIIRKEKSVEEQVINIMFMTHNERFIENWITDYLNIEIEKLKLCPLQKGIKNIEYVIVNETENESSENEFSFKQNRTCSSKVLLSVKVMTLICSFSTKYPPKFFKDVFLE